MLNEKNKSAKSNTCLRVLHLDKCESDSDLVKALISKIKSYCDNKYQYIHRDDVIEQRTTIINQLCDAILQTRLYGIDNPALEVMHQCEHISFVHGWFWFLFSSRGTLQNDISAILKCHHNGSIKSNVKTHAEIMSDLEEVVRARVNDHVEHLQAANDILENKLNKLRSERNDLKSPTKKSPSTCDTSNPHRFHSPTKLYETNPTIPSIPRTGMSNT